MKKKTYAIKDIPNNDDGRTAAQLLKDYTHYTYRRHGRGHRFGLRSYHQELPLSVAERFTLYCYPRAQSSWDKDYYTFAGVRDGKPVIRQCLNGAKP